MQVQENIQNYLDMEDEKLAYLAKEIWDHPEIGLQETFAANLLSTELEQAGFRLNGASGRCRLPLLPVGARASRSSAFWVNMMRCPVFRKNFPP